MTKPTAAGQVGLNCPGCGENLGRSSVAQSHPTAGGQYRRRYCPRCHAGVETIETVKGEEAKVIIIDVTDLLDSERRAVNAVIREFRRLHGTYDEFTGKLKAERERRWGRDHEEDCSCIVCEARRRPARPEPMFQD